MRHSLLQYLACPVCQGDLSLKVKEEHGEHVNEGTLVCTKGHSYQITKSVPRFVQNITSEQEKTKKMFGFEWRHWNTFGWDGYVSMERSRKVFEYKMLMRSGDLTGKLVLDAGCGNGRYTQVAADFGGDVIGMDFSESVDPAYENTKDNPKIHIIQADIFHPPFKRGIFHFVFSNGVLMHTGDARKAFLSLTRFLTPDGSITAHLYHKGNPLYEFNDWWMREIMTRLPFSWAYQICRALEAFARLFSDRVVQSFNAVFHLEKHIHFLFDWYTAPVATHHTYPEVYGWVKEANLHLIQDHNVTKYPMRKWFLPFFFLTVKAGKQAPKGGPLHTLT